MGVKKAEGAREDKSSDRSLSGRNFFIMHAASIYDGYIQLRPRYYREVKGNAISFHLNKKFHSHLSSVNFQEL